MSGPQTTFACQACSEPNPASRLLCQGCGALLEPGQPPLAPSWSPGMPWRRRGALILLGLAFVAAVAAVLLGMALKSGGLLAGAGPPTWAGAGPPARAGAAPGTVRTPASPVLVDQHSISASASSELPPTSDVDYSIRNTLDGDLRTAWNSHSAVTGDGVGQTLRYRFPRRVHLVHIALVNGYAKNGSLWAANSRIRGVAITTDDRRVHVVLSDTASRQQLDRDLGVTREVTLRVTSIYPGARYNDLALTEIAFWAAPG